MHARPAIAPIFWMLAGAAAAQDGTRDEALLGDTLKAAIDDGHRWLLRHQDADGRWSASMFVVHDPKGEPCSGVGKPDQDVFVTALVVTACYGVAQLPSDPRNDHVVRATRWLAAQLREDGSIGQPSSRTLVRDTAAASNVLVSAHRYSHPDGLGADMAATAAWLDRHRRPDGSWPIAGEGSADAVTTAFALEFLTQHDGRAPTEVLPSIAALDEGAPAIGHAAAAHLGAWYVRDADMRERACEALAGEAARATGARGHDPLAAYFTAQAMQFHAPAKWDAWWRSFVAATLRAQRRDGSFAGSWDPSGELGREGGRVFSTAATLLALEVVWRRQFRDR